MPPDNNIVVKGMMNSGFMYLEHIDDESCWMTGFINVDLNFAYIPDWFLNFIMKRVIYVMIGKISSKEMFENETIKAKVEERKEFWDKVQSKLREMVNDDLEHKILEEL